MLWSFPRPSAAGQRWAGWRGDRSFEAIREAIAIGEKAKLPVQITHLKLGTVAVWGQAPEVVDTINAARKRGVDVTADVYPYLAWSSNLKVLVPDQQWTSPASVKEALDDVGGGRNVQITRLPKFPQFIGQWLDEAAKAAGVSDRGRIAVGMKADLVLFDPATVIDRSTFETPKLRARGIHSVFVNGALVWSGDQPAGNRPGRVLTRR